MPFSYSVLWQATDSLCLRIKFKWDNTQKRCPLSGTGLTDPTLQQQHQNLPMGRLVPGAFSAKTLVHAFTEGATLLVPPQLAAPLQLLPPKRRSAE